MEIARRRRSRAEIEAGALADVSMLLLAFFVLTTALGMRKGLDWRNEEGEVRVATPRAAVDVLVTGEGRVRVDGVEVGVDGVAAEVARRLRREPDTPVVVRSVADAPYGTLVEALDELRRAPDTQGVTIGKLSLPTLREQRIYWPRDARGR